MHTSLSRWTGHGLAAFMLAMGVLTLDVSMRTHREYDDIDQPSRFSVTGFASRADHELTRLEFMVSQASVAGSGVTVDDVGLWYDIVVSRTDVLENGKFAGRTAGVAEIGELVRSMRATTRALEPLIGHVDRVEVARQALTLLRSLDEKVTGFAVDTYSQAETLDRESARILMGLHDRFTELALGMLLLTALLTWVLHRKNGALTGSAARQRALASELEASNLALARQAGLFDEALNNMTQGLCMLSPDGAVEVHNGRFAELMVPGAVEVTGLALGELAASVPGPLAALLRREAETGSGDEPVAVLDLGDGTAIERTRRAMPDGGTVLTFQDVSERRRAEERIAFMAHHDDLTGLFNRRHFHERLEEVLARANAACEATLVLAVDLDGFKPVNDTYGHDVGDAVLREVAWRLRDGIGPDDVIARLGGDEFAIVHPVRDRDDDGTALAYRLIAAVCEPIPTKAGEVRLGTSIGIAGAPEDGMAAGDLMKSADVALYAAKGAGRGTVCLYDACADVEGRERRSLALDLCGAASRGELVLHFQPIVDARTGVPMLYEALVRWKHPERGLVPPNVFIPMAEETGEILHIGEWVIDEACRVARAWPEDVGVAVNLSAVQFSTGRVPQMVAAALARSGLTPSRLEVELTESVLLHDCTDTVRTLTALKELGVKIAMDDFGTGYASMSYLHRFPFDKIKIDQSFVRGLKPGARGSEIVHSMTELAGRLSLVSCAEGVETRDQADALVEMGLGQLQGYLFGRPEPIAEVPEHHAVAA